MQLVSKKKALGVALALYLTGSSCALAADINQTVTQDLSITENTKIIVTTPIPDFGAVGVLGQSNSITISTSNNSALTVNAYDNSSNTKLGAYGVSANGKIVTVRPDLTIDVFARGTGNITSNGLTAFNGTVNTANVNIAAGVEKVGLGQDSRAYGVYAELGQVNINGNANIELAAIAPAASTGVWAYGIYDTASNISVTGTTNIQSRAVNSVESAKMTGVIANSGDFSISGAKPGSAIGTAIINLSNTNINLTANNQAFGVVATTGKGSSGQSVAVNTATVNVNGNLTIDLQSGSDNAVAATALGIQSTAFSGEPLAAAATVNVQGKTTINVVAKADATTGNLSAAAGYTMGNATINLNGGLDANVVGTANHTEVYGLYASEGANINVNGAIKLSAFANNGNDIVTAALADNGAHINLNTGSNSANNLVNIIGDLYAGEKSETNVILGASGSKLKGRTGQIGTGKVNIGMNNGTDWLVTGNSQVNELLTSGNANIHSDTASTIAVKNLYSQGFVLDNAKMSVSNKFNNAGNINIINAAQLTITATEPVVSTGNITADGLGSMANIALSGIAASMNGAVNATNGATANISLSDSAIWTATGNSNINSLTIKGGILATNTANGITVNIKDINSASTGGNFIISANSTAKTTDSILVDGTNILDAGLDTTLYNISIIDKNPATNIGAPIARNLTQAAATQLANSSTTNAQIVDGGVFEYKPVYTAQENGSGKYDVVLSGGNQEGQKSTGSKVAERSVNASISALRATTNELQKRMGELHDNKNSGIWARHYAQKDAGNGFSAKTNSIQVGIDKHTTLKNGDIFTGIAVSHSSADITFDNLVGSGNSSNTTFGIYTSYLAKDNQYVDVIAKYGKFNNKYNAIKKTGVATSGEYDTKGFSLSVEYGKKILLSKGAYVTPHIEAIVGNMSGADYVTNDGIRANVGSSNLFTLRGGATIGKDIQTKNGTNTMFMRALVAHEFAGSSNIKLVDGFGNIGNFKVGGSDTWFELAVGGTVKLSQKADMYLEVERTFGGKITSAWKYNIGARFGF